MCGLSILAFFKVLSIYLKTRFVFQNKNSIIKPAPMTTKLISQQAKLLQPGVLQPKVLTTRDLNTRGSYIQRSYNQGC